MREFLHQGGGGETDSLRKLFSSCFAVEGAGNGWETVSNDLYRRYQETPDHSSTKKQCKLFPKICLFCHVTHTISSFWKTVTILFPLENRKPMPSWHSFLLNLPYAPKLWSFTKGDGGRRGCPIRARWGFNIIIPWWSYHGKFLSTTDLSDMLQSKTWVSALASTTKLHNYKWSSRPSLTSLFHEGRS